MGTAGDSAAAGAGAAAEDEEMGEGEEGSGGGQRELPAVNPGQLLRTKARSQPGMSAQHTPQRRQRVRGRDGTLHHCDTDDAQRQPGLHSTRCGDWTVLTPSCESCRHQFLPETKHR